MAVKIANRQRPAPGTLTKGEALNIWNNWKHLAAMTGRKFVFSLHRNKALLRPIVRELEKIKAPIPAIKEMQDELRKLAAEYALKDAHGIEAREPNGTMKISPERWPEFKKKEDEILEKYSAAVQEFEAQEARYQAALKEQVELRFHLIPLEVVSENITETQMAVIFPMIENREEER